MKEPNKSTEVFSEIRKLIDQGDYSRAYELIQSAGNITDFHEVNIASPLIETGSGLKNIGLIKKGIGILEKWLGKIKDERSLVTINYNLTNGYMVLYEQPKSMNKWDISALPYNENMQKAKRYLRKARSQITLAAKSEQPKIITNYGNCLDDLGRGLEALKAYDEALEIAPGFKMALGNKAIAIRRFADIAGKFRGAIYVEAHQLLKSIIDDPEIIRTVSANERFKREMNEIESKFPDKTKLDADLKHKRYSDDGLSDFEKFYLDFCSKNRLFLNLHIQDNTCDAAVVDSVFISILEPKSKNERFLELSKIINQIKEDFMIARLLLVESLYKKDEFDRLSRRIALVNARDDSVFHIYAGLLKTAFRLTYDTLDKIAFFINDYVGLRMDDNCVYFTNIWEDKGKIKESLLNVKNISLYALYDVYLDLKKGGHFERLRLIRHSLVHRKLILYSGEKSSYDNAKDCNSIGWDTMINKTIEIMYLVKSAIIYMINCVEIEEKKVAGKLKGAVINRVEPDTTQEL